MIKAVFYKKKGGSYIEFSVSGHAGYDTHGKDIVCSGVSVLVINTINAIKEYTNDSSNLETKIFEGTIKVKFNNDICSETKLLIDTLILGLDSIYQEYGKKYLKLYFKEV